MTCRRFQREVADWLAGRLDPETACGMDAHRDRCAACARAARAEARLRARWQAPAPPAPDVRRRVAARLAAPPPRRPAFGPGSARRLVLGGAVLLALAAAGARRPAPSDAPAGPVPSVPAVSGAPAAGPRWTTLADVSRVNPAVDDPLGASMDDVWTHLNLDTKPGAGRDDAQ